MKKLFALDLRARARAQDGIIRINPDMLLKKVKEAFEKYLANLKRNPRAFKQFKESLKKDFEKEVEREKYVT